jgi:hypothetical protein
MLLLQVRSNQNKRWHILNTAPFDPNDPDSQFRAYCELVVHSDNWRTQMPTDVFRIVKGKPAQ